MVVRKRLVLSLTLPLFAGTLLFAAPPAGSQCRNGGPQAAQIAALRRAQRSPMLAVARFAPVESPDCSPSRGFLMLQQARQQNAQLAAALEQARQENLGYVKSWGAALAARDAEGTQAVFLMNATRVVQVKAVSDAGEVMPQKSTYFYPKIASGLVMNPIVLDEDVDPV